MKALLSLFFRAAHTRRDDLIRANQFTENARFSPYLAMLPGIR
jgi:hypothetical protein